MFPMHPDILDRIQFRCVGRQVFQMDPTAEILHEFPYQLPR